MQGTSGSIIWQIPARPSNSYSYRVTPTFGNETGQLVASRCLGPTAPALCMYSAFAQDPSASAAARYEIRTAIFMAIVVILLQVLL
jgi:hypothetical protein